MERESRMTLESSSGSTSGVVQALERVDRPADDLLEVISRPGLTARADRALRGWRSRARSTRSYGRRDPVCRAAKAHLTDDATRAGIRRTLHRISAIRNRRGDIVGLTCRVGLAPSTGTIDIIQDIIEAGNNVLILGPPGGREDDPAARGGARPG